MRVWLMIIMFWLALITVGCARRPVRDDVATPGGPATHQANPDEEIKSSPGAEQAPFELQVIDTTIELRLYAIDAEQLVATRAEHVELKHFSNTAISEQRNEVTSLRQLRSSWFGNQPKAVDLELPGASEGLHTIDADKLDRLKESGFDLEFISQMTSYLDSVDRMASDLLNKDVRPELKQIAQSIVNSDAQKIEQLKRWETDWKKR